MTNCIVRTHIALGKMGRKPMKWKGKAKGEGRAAQKKEERGLFRVDQRLGKQNARFYVSNKIGGERETTMEGRGRKRMMGLCEGR